MLLAGVNLQIVKHAAAARQAQDRGEGQRPPAGLAGAPVRLATIKGQTKDPETPVGYKTAVRGLPRFLAALPPRDPRLEVALMLAGSYERVGAVKGADLGGTDSNGGFSDGGATTRVKHAARLRLIRYLANGWPVCRVNGPSAWSGEWPEKAALAPQRRSPKRQAIMAFPALVAVCVDGWDLSRILRAAGWSVQNANRAQLALALLNALDDIAEGLGIGRSAPKEKS